MSALNSSHEAFLDQSQDPEGAGFPMFSPEGASKGSRPCPAPLFDQLSPVSTRT
jgi:hypothetical protein